MLIWGDIQKYVRPIVRRTLIGNSAHECMYAWVYLTDLLLLKKYNEYLIDKNYQFKDLLDTLEHLSNDRRVDPNFQFSRESYIISMVISRYISFCDESVEIVELGSTFFNLKNKIDLILLKTQKNRKQIIFIGIDNSDFMKDCTKVLHNDFIEKIKIIKNYNEYNKIEKNNIFTSRFVSSYAFKNTEEFIKFLRHGNFELLIFEEAFGIDGFDINTENHGQTITYFSLNKLISFANLDGYKLIILGIYPDNPALSGRCLVIRIMMIKEKLNFNLDSLINEIRINFPSIKDEIIINNLIDEVKNITKNINWKIIDKYKLIEPVWGKSPVIQRNMIMKFTDFLFEIKIRIKTGYILLLNNSKNSRNHLKNYLKNF